MFDFRSQFLFSVNYKYLVSFVLMQVLAFNGKPVKNLKSLAEMVENCDDEFLKFDLEYEQVFLLSIHASTLPTHALVALCIYVCAFMQIVVLRTKTAKAATPDILATHCIPSAMSEDLKA